MTKLNESNHEDVAGALLARLGRDLAAPLAALLAQIHAVDERHAEDDGAAHLVELGYALQRLIEPLTELARLEAASVPASTEQVSREAVDLGALIDETVASPELAASFEVSVRGELGASFTDASRLADGLSFCLRLMSRMTGNKTPVQVHREVHQPSDKIVIAVPIEEPDEVALVLLKRAAGQIRGSVDVSGSVVLLGFPVSATPDGGQPSSRPPKTGPVLAFQRMDAPAATEHDVPERASIVLVVDHEPAAQDYMGRILELEGFEVVKSFTLEDGYQQAHAYKPDVIILDRLQLSYEGGDWVRRFKDDPALARVPLVLVQSEESESLGLVGIADVVRKPIDPDEVVATLDRLTGAGSAPVVVVGNGKDSSEWERLLDGTSNRIVNASSLADAERILDSVTPGALIVDVRAHDGSLALLEALRRGDRTRDIPVIAVHGRLTKKARLQLETLADRCLMGSELSRRAVQDLLRELSGGERSELGVS